MTAAEFWDGIPYLTVSYREANKLSAERTNGNAWWQGFYIRQAVQSALSVSLPWFKNKSIEYPKQPFRITPPSEKEQKTRAQQERDKAVKSLNAWKEAWDKKYGRKE